MNEKIVERIRKMLALANDKGASEGERDNAMRAVHAYLAKYNLDLATVEQAKGAQKTSESQEPRVFHPASFYGRPWARNVCVDVANLLFCSYLFHAATKAKETRHYFIGRHSNAVTASLMAEFLVTSITQEGRRQQRIHQTGNAWFRSFATGASASINRRVAELLAAGRSTPATRTPRLPDNGTPGTSVALAGVYDREQAANAELIRAQLGRDPRIRGGGKKQYVADAVFAGAEYGDTVSLDRQIRG